MSARFGETPSVQEIDSYVRRGRELQAHSFALNMKKIKSISGALFRR